LPNDLPLHEFVIYQQIDKRFQIVQRGTKFQATCNTNILGGIADYALEKLARLTNEGSEVAAIYFHNILSKHVSFLCELCRENPKLFEPIARKTTFWPALISCLNDEKKKNKNLLSLLSVGRDTGINISGKQPAWNTPEVMIANNLRVMLELYRKDWDGRIAYAKRLNANFKRINKRLGRPADYQPPPAKPIRLPPELSARLAEEFRLRDESRILARKLQPLNRQNYKEWFKAGLPLLQAEQSKDFENLKCFAHYWASPVYKGKKNARALIRDAIKKKIKQALRSIAPKSPPIG